MEIDGSGTTYDGTVEDGVIGDDIVSDAWVNAHGHVVAESSAEDGAVFEGMWEGEVAGGNLVACEAYEQIGPCWGKRVGGFGAELVGERFWGRDIETIFVDETAERGSVAFAVDASDEQSEVDEA